MSKMIFTRPVLYAGRMYNPGDEAPAIPDMMALWRQYGTVREDAPAHIVSDEMGMNEETDEGASPDMTGSEEARDAEASEDEAATAKVNWPPVQTQTPTVPGRTNPRRAGGAK